MASILYISSQSRVFISVNIICMVSDLYYMGAGHGRVGQDMIVDKVLCVGTHMGYAWCTE